MNRTERMINIGNRIKEERKRLGLKKQELMQKLGLSKSAYKTLKTWEDGTAMPRVETLARMAELFHCDIGYLLCDYDQRSRETADVCELTGLSEAATLILKVCKEEGLTTELKALSGLLSNKETQFFRVLSAIAAASANFGELREVYVYKAGSQFYKSVAELLKKPL